MTTCYAYVGGELDLFAAATRWKSYFRSHLEPYVGSEVLEVGAGLGGTTQVATDANGIAAFSNLSLNLLVGTWQLEFIDATKSLTAAISTAIVLSPGPAQSIIAWPAGPDTTFITAGETLSPAVKVIDKVGNGIPGVPVGWKTLDNLSLLPDSPSTQTDASGVASPGRWVTIPGVPGPFLIQASPSLSGLENAPLTLWAVLKPLG